MSRIKLRWPKMRLGEAAKVYAHFGSHLRPQRGALLGGGGCLLGVALMELVRPWPVKIVFDYVLFTNQSSSRWGLLAFLEQSDPYTALGIAVGGLLVVAIATGWLNYGQKILLTGVGHRVTGAIRFQLFSHIQQLPQSYHDYRETGDLMMRLTGDINLLKDLLVTVVLKLGSRIFVVIGMLGVMLWMDWSLTLIALGVIPVLLLVNVHFSGRLKNASRRQRKKMGELAASMHEGLTGQGLIRVYTQEKRHAKEFGKQVLSDIKAGLKLVRLEVSFARTVEIISALGMGAVLWFGVQRVMDDTLSAGDLMVFFSYMRVVYKPLRDIATQSTRLAKAIAAGQRIIEVLDLETQAADAPDAVSAKSIRGDIRFDAVNFQYHEGTPILRNVSCHLPPERTTLIVGASGSGKSTMAKLLLRLYENTESGRVLIDDRDIRVYKLRELRKQMTSLAQDITMFHASVRENIGFGNPRRDFEAIVAAAEKVGADEFIGELPDGYETTIGEGGLTLSGGQRQRLAFARAALRDSKIMIFDEPATGLDARAEHEAKNALKVLKPGRTTVIITHRLNFLDLADHVVLLENGHVVEEGAPDALIRSGGTFADYVATWQSQVHASTKLADVVNKI